MICTNLTQVSSASNVNIPYELILWYNIRSVGQLDFTPHSTCFMKSRPSGVY